MHALAYFVLAEKFLKERDADTREWQGDDDEERAAIASQASVMTLRSGPSASHQTQSSRQHSDADAHSARSSRRRRAVLPAALCGGALAVGVTAIAGYVLANAFLASWSASGKPIPLVTAVALCLLAGGLSSLLFFSTAGPRIARGAADAVLLLLAADLSSSLLASNGEWQTWAARGGVHFHAYPVPTLFLLMAAVALYSVASGKELLSHVVASASLLACVAVLFAYALRVPAVLDLTRRIVPVPATTVGLGMIALATLLTRPRGWLVPLRSQTSAGVISRWLLPVTLLVPLLAIVLRDAVAGAPWFTPEAGLAIVVVANLFCGVAVLFGAVGVLHKRERDRARLAAIVDAADEGIIRVSLSGLIEYWNAGAERMYGYTAAEIVGRPILIIVPEDLRGDVARLPERIRNGEVIEACETRRVAKDGSRVDVWLRLTPVLSDEGIPIGISAIAQNISPRRQAEESLRISESRYRDLVETTGDGVWTIDESCRITYSSIRMAGILGYRSEELKGRLIFDFFAPAPVEYVEQHVQAMFRGARERFEFALVRKDGATVHVIITTTPMLDESGGFAGAMGAMTDITERIQAERALKSSEAALKEAQRIAHIGHWSMSIATGEGVWSDEHYRILGIPIGSVIQTHELFMSMIEREDLQRLTAESERLVASLSIDDSFAIDLRMTTPGGRKIVVSETVFVDRDLQGEFAGFHGTFQDITRRVTMEEALRRSEADLALAQQIAHIGSWTLDVDTGDVAASAESYRLFHLPADSRQADFSRRIHREDREPVRKEIAASLASGSGEVEFRIVRDDGSVRVARAVARQRDGGASLSTLIGTIEDITEKRLAEQALREYTERLQQTNSELERFNRLAVGRELRMLELKQQINELRAELGRPSLYAVMEKAQLMEAS